MPDDRPLAPLARRFHFNDNVLGAVSAGMEGADWSTPAAAVGAADVGRTPGGNSAHWILGHLTATRRYLARKLGADLPLEPWEPWFQQGAQPSASDAYPDPRALIELFVAAGRALEERARALDADALERPFGGRLPDGSDRLGSAAHFLYFHETYHLGQLGLLRRARGLPGFA